MQLVYYSISVGTGGNEREENRVIRASEQELLDGERHL